jgi:Xaa-Pro aminopeptidase
MRWRPISYSKVFLFLGKAMGVGVRELEEMRGAFDREGIDGYVLMKRDEHASEYVGECDDTISHFCKFTGSNASALILRESAILFTDSRYFIQAKQELPEGIELGRMGKDKSLEERVLELPPGTRIGMNPMHRYMYEEKGLLLEKAKKKGIDIRWVGEAFIDSVWKNRPKRHFGKIEDVGLAGRSVEEKIEEVRKEVENGSVLLLSALDEIAWLLNLRGSDIRHSRLFYSYAVLSCEEIVLFANGDIEGYLPENLVLRKYEEFYDFLEEASRSGKYLSILLSRSTNRRILNVLEGALIEEKEVIGELKAIKSPEEIGGFVEANIRDAVSICRLFSSIEQDLGKGMEVGEMDIAERLLEIKREDPDFITPSFETISAYGKNGAVVHYSPRDNSVKLKKESLFLLDSGSQYSFGTTDITRTVAFGSPKDDEKSDYTLVVKANIGLQRAVFPKGTAGWALDVLARIPLWERALDYGHSTGHGVGFCLNVHEGPHGLGKGAATPLKTGMTLTNEPGLYREGQHGIRHENLMVVEKKESGFLGFTNITPLPFHLALLKRDLLTGEEIAFINSESSRIRDLLRNRVSAYPEALEYLLRNTESIGADQ